jgi:hypothetical protein
MCFFVTLPLKTPAVKHGMTQQLVPSPGLDDWHPTRKSSIGDALILIPEERRQNEADGMQSGSELIFYYKKYKTIYNTKYRE